MGSLKESVFLYFVKINYYQFIIIV